MFDYMFVYLLLWVFVAFEEVFHDLTFYLKFFNFFLFHLSIYSFHQILFESLLYIQNP